MQSGYICPLCLDLGLNSAIQVAAQEWIFGLRRGGLYYYLQSQENHAFCEFSLGAHYVNLTNLPVREDISDLFDRGEFILAPTYKTYLDPMDFIECAGIKGRRVNDRSARRPLYAAGSISLHQ